VGADRSGHGGRDPDDQASAAGPLPTGIGARAVSVAGRVLQHRPQPPVHRAGLRRARHVPAGLPGYRRYCPYTLSPRADGAYTGPDLARARRLVGESGTSGERVDVWGASDNAYVPATVPAYGAGVLRALGYRVRLHLVPFASITEAMHERFQLSVDGDWVANYPDPSSCLPQFFGCGGGNSNGYYCNQRLDREMQQARQLELSDPAKASARWESIDRQLTNDAIWVPTVNQREVDLVSERLRNYEYNPVWGFLADQAWLRN
jgi:peptide/nickel transport system substrate-binding protein